MAIKNENGVSTDRGKEVQGSPIVRLRVADLFSGIGFGALLAALGFIYGVFRDVGEDTRREIRTTEERIVKRIERLESRVDRISESR